MTGKPLYDYQAILAEYNNHHNIPDTACALGCNRKTVEKALRKLGISPSRKKKECLYGKDHPVNDKQLLIGLYAAGSSFQKIGRQIGVSSSTVRLKLIAFGAKIRDKKTAQAGSRHPGWKGGRRQKKTGHIEVLTEPKRYQYEHRVVMERHLGRKLETHEIVHHKDGNPENNHISNLKLYDSISEHMSDGHPHRKKHSEESRLKMSVARKAAWQKLDDEEKKRRVAVMRSAR